MEEITNLKCKCGNETFYAKVGRGVISLECELCHAEDIDYYIIG